MRQYMAENREAYNESRRIYYSNNKEKWQKYNQQYVTRDRDAYNAKQRENYTVHAEERREAKRLYRVVNREAIYERRRVQRLANRDAIKAWHRAYRAANAEARRAYDRNRKKQKTPSWVDRKMLRAIKKARPADCHTDHIVPLKGLTPEGYEVTGLNVPWNLQYLPITEHLRKRSRMRDHDFSFALISEPVLHPSLVLSEGAEPVGRARRRPRLTDTLQLEHEAQDDYNPQPEAVMTC